MQVKAVVPILRIFDETKAREFYLGFAVDFEHRFEEGAPLYCGISRGGARLHLSEHHGDGSPGGRVRLEIDDIEALHAELSEKRYKYNRPGLETMPWGTREVSTYDPFGNRIIFVGT